MARLADPKPPACAVCLQPPMLNPEMPFVDFEVAFEGPVYNPRTRHGEEVTPEQTVPIPIDDLMICEDCLKRGAELIGMVQGEEARVRIEQLEATVAAKDEEIAEKDKAISNLDYSVGYLIDAEKVAKRPQGKPRIDAPETHIKERDQLRKNRAARERAAKKRKKVTA